MRKNWKVKKKAGESAGATGRATGSNETANSALAARRRRQPYLRVEILMVLEACQGFLLPQSTLLLQLRLFAFPAPDEAGLVAALKSLARESLAVTVESSLDGGPRWKITDGGRALLGEHVRPLGRT